MTTPLASRAPSCTARERWGGGGVELEASELDKLQQNAADTKELLRSVLGYECWLQYAKLSTLHYLPCLMQTLNPIREFRTPNH